MLSTALLLAEQSPPCAVIMSIATVEVIREAIGALVDGLAHGE